MSSFDALKKARSKSLDKLSEQLEKINQRGVPDQNSEKYWKPTRDQAGNSFAIIRFLPPPQGEDVPFVRLWDHGFQGPGGWYIENSLTTLGLPDPASEYNSKLWNSGSDENKKLVQKQKRRLHFISNIYVVKDSGNPENEGKVFLYKYGKKVFDKINTAIKPEFEDEARMDPFNLWTGANLRLKVRMVEGYPNYDRSEWDSPGPLFDDDAKLEEIYNQEYSLAAEIDPSNFKSYDELKAKFYRAIGLSSDAPTNTTKSAEMDDSELDMSSLGKSASAPSHKEMSSTDDEDDDLAFFKSLASGE